MITRAETYLQLLGELRGVYDDGERAAVDQLKHSLQTATRARQAGADDELVAVALLHDVFRVLAPATHGETAAVALADRISTHRLSVLRFHTDWQHDAINGTDRASLWADAPWYADACRLGEWDAASFDPHYPTVSLGVFAPLLRRILD